MNSALIVAAHPDDEILGCGATMARLAAEGWAVHILILAEGATSRYDSRDRDGRAGELSELARCARAAGAIVGAQTVELDVFPDNRMDAADLLDVVKRVEAAIATCRPIRVFTHNMHDVNIDHRITHDAVIAATRSKPGATVRELFFFEVLSSTEWRPPTSLPPFAPTYYFDVSEYIETKIRALDVYVPEMLEFPHPRSNPAVRALAAFRGCTAGVPAAEAFEVGRIIV